MKRVAGAVVAAVVVGVLTGCSSPTPEPPAPTVSRTPSATPTPTATSEVNDESDTALGIVFGPPPALEGDEALVYNWVSVFEREYWRTMTTNEVGPGLDLFTSPDAQAEMESVAAANRDIQADIGGQVSVVISDIVVDGASATASVCADYSNATFASSSGSYTPEEAGFAPPIHSDVTLSRAGEGLWIVQNAVENGQC